MSPQIQHFVKTTEILSLALKWLILEGNQHDVFLHVVSRLNIGLIISCYFWDLSAHSKSKYAPLAGSKQ